MILGTTGSIGGTALTTTGIGAPVALSAVAVSAIAITNGVSRVASAGEVIQNGDLNIHFVKPEGSSNSGELKEIYNSIKDSPNYPEGFEPRQNGTTKGPVKNKQLLEQLRGVESGTWKKVYKDGYDAAGNKISIHYFQNQSGKVFDVKVKPEWSN